MDEALRRKVCRLIAGIVVSDDDLDDQEDAFIDRMLVAFDIPVSERETIFPIVDRSEAAEAMKELPKEAQVEALAMLIDAAVVDGKVVDEERAYLHTVAEAVGLTTADVDKRVNDALTKKQ